MSKFVHRPQRVQDVREAVDRAPLVALLGPRQCGKTTLSSEVAGAKATYFDLERGADRQSLAVVAEQTLGPLRRTVVLDEVQTMPELLPTLRVLADRPKAPAKFLRLGRASPDLIRGASETLAGRVAFVYLRFILGLACLGKASRWNRSSESCVRNGTRISNFLTFFERCAGFGFLTL